MLVVLRVVGGSARVSGVRDKVGDMSVFELFKRFFHPPGTRDPFFGGMTLDDDDDEKQDDDNFFHHHSGFSRHPFHDPFGFEDFFRDFNELFADLGSMVRDVPRLPGAGPPARGPGSSGTGSLRDFMLKYPDSHLPRDQTPPPGGPGTSEGPDQPRWPSPWREDDGATVRPGDHKVDKILDSEVTSRGLDSVLRSEEPPSSSSSSYFRSVSVSRVLRPDGTVEERRTVKDSEGNATTTVTVTSGDQVISDDKDSALVPHRSLPDLSDSQTILSRILQKWFSN